MHNYMNLNGRVALITGGSSGIGAATADVFAELGARVAIGYFRNQQGAEEVVSRLSVAGHRVTAIRADVRHTTEIRRLVSRVVDELGPIDILVNNAGSLVRRETIQELTDDSWDEVVALNLKSAAMASQQVAASMISRRTGVIVNVGSLAGHNGGGPGALAYASAKAGLVALTKALAKELAPSGIRVNAISPGIIDTPFHRRYSTPEMLQAFLRAIPAGRMGRAEECATVIAFLASDAASYVMGETFEVNGGQLMR